MAGEPHSRADLASALATLHRESAELFESLSVTELFHHPEEGSWSAAENVIHLIRSVRAVAMAMKIPKLVLAARFGPAFSGSRTYEEVRQDYLGRLAAGGVAGGPYVPSTMLPDGPEEAGRMRVRALDGWRRAGAGLERQVGKWSEKALDRYRLPHPLLGKLTVREMLFFTHYHDRHHVGIVERCREAAVASGS